MLMQGGTDDSQVHCPHPAHHEKELTANPYQPKDQKAIYRPERGLQAVRSGGLILYAYITTQMETNGYGGVIGHKNYICYGVLNGNSIEDKEDRIDFVTIRKSEENHSYIEYYYDRKIYEDGTHYDIYAGAALYLTNDMLKNLKTSN